MAMTIIISNSEYPNCLLVIGILGSGGIWFGAHGGDAENNYYSL